jgi:hypothetical protein
MDGMLTAGPNVVGMLGDAERCVAWAILAEVEAGISAP